MQNFGENMNASWRFFLKVLPNLLSNCCLGNDKWVSNFGMELHWSLLKISYLCNMITKVSICQAFQNTSLIPPSIQTALSSSCSAWQFKKCKNKNSRNKVQELSQVFGLCRLKMLYSQANWKKPRMRLCHNIKGLLLSILITCQKWRLMQVKIKRLKGGRHAVSEVQEP